MIGAVLGFALFALLILACAVLVSVVRIHQVEEGQEAVVFRWGRFFRVAEPGLVFLLRNADKIKHEVDTREQPHYVRVTERFNFIPVDVTFVLWARTDMREAAQTAGVPLTELVLFSDAEREHRLQLMVLSAARRAMRDAERIDDSARSELGYLQDLLPLLPGLPPSLRLTDALAQELADTLPTIGVMLNPKRRIDIYHVAPPDEIVDNISRERTILQLREMFPKLDEDVIVQALTAFEDKDMPQIKRLKFDGADLSVQVDTEWDDERIRMRPVPRREQAPADDGRVPQPEPEESPNGVEILTPEDLDVLKPIPPFQGRSAS